MSAITIEPVDDLDARFDPQPWLWAEAEAARIDAHWATLRAQKPALFDGRVLLLQHRGQLATEDGRRVFRAAYFETSFRAFLAWRDFGFPDTTVVNAFAMAALQSADGAFLLGRMGGHTANAGRVYFPAGTPDPSDRRGPHVDLEGSVLRELGEETGLEADDVVLDPGWTLVRDGQRLACMKAVRTHASADAVVRRVERDLAQQSSPELDGLVVVRREADLVDAMPPFTRAYLRWRLSGVAG